MSRLLRDHRIETRDARAKLPGRSEPYWREIYRGTALGYRRSDRKNCGSWIIRQYHDGRYKKKTLGLADDFEEANGRTIYSYRQAAEAAHGFHAPDPSLGYTVKNACEDYLADYEVRSGRDTANIERCFEKLVYPTLGNEELANLTSAQLRRWLNRRAKDGTREQKSTANKHLTKLKAALNLAFRDGRAKEDRAWRVVKPFPNVDAPRVRIVSLAECQRLVQATDEEFRPMVRAALLTGCRYGELCRLRVRDFYGDHLHIAESKSGKPRDVPLTDEGKAFFSDAVTGRVDDDFILNQRNGEPWGKNLQQRRMQAACAAAEIIPPISFHILRHAYGGGLAKAGVSLQIIAAVLGHADTRITEKHYAHLAPSHVAEVIRKHLPRLEV